MNQLLLSIDDSLMIWLRGDVVSFVYSERRIDDFASKVELPEEWFNVQVDHPNIPPLFVVNAQVRS